MSSFNPGIYWDMLERVYRDADGICQTDLKKIERSEAHLKANVELEEDREDSEALLMGRLTGTLALEPDREPWWVIKPDEMSFATKDGKAWKKENESQGTIVPYSVFRRASGMATALLDCPKPEVRDLLRGARHEVSVFADLETIFGPVRCKARPDIVCQGNVLADLKTTLDARPEPFKKSVRRFGYQIQAASYLKLWNAVCAPDEEKEFFLFVAVEKFPPYDIMVHRLDQLTMDLALDNYLSLLHRYAHSVHTNEWPGYPAGISTISLQ